MTEKKIPEFSRILRRITVFSVCLFFFFCVFVVNNADAKEDALKESTETMSYFQSFSMQLQNGEGEFTQDDLKDYQITVINGWAPWCHGCVDEMPDLQKLSEEYKDKGLQVVGVVADYYENTHGDQYDGEIRSVVDGIGITYPVILSDEKFYDQVEPMMNNCFPGTWVVDSEGNLIDFVSASQSEEAWRDYFDRWLAGESGIGGGL